MQRPDIPPAYAETAQRLIDAGVPEDIACNPNDASGLAAWLAEGDD